MANHLTIHLERGGRLAKTDISRVLSAVRKAVELLGWSLVTHEFWHRSEDAEFRSKLAERFGIEEG